MSIVPVPARFQYGPFFSGITTIEWRPGDWQTVLQTQYFMYDILEQQADVPKPWDSIEESIPAVFSLWRSRRDQLAACFRQRRRQAARADMVLYTAHLVSILHWLNGTAVQGLPGFQQLAQFRWKPVNAEERLQFIYEQPDHYHSFIQLTQLYEEIEKLFYKASMMQKRTKPPM